MTKVQAYGNHKQIRPDMIGIAGNDICVADVWLCDRVRYPQGLKVWFAIR